MDKRYITILNVIACFAVVVLHANGVFWSFSVSNQWISANVIESVFYFAVPIFFMISGTTLFEYRKRYDTKTFFKKRAKKTLIPFLIWTFIFLFIAIFDFRIISIRRLWNVKWLINSIINTEIMNYYWFFIPLFAFYLCLPIISLITELEEEKQKQVIKYILIVGFSINILLPFILPFFDLKYNGNLQVGIISGYLIYPFCGYYVDRYNIDKKWRIGIYLLGFAGLLVHIFGTWILSFEAGSIIQTYKGYTNVPCFFYSLAIYLFFRNLDLSKLNNKFYNVIKWFSSASFGVYLIQGFVLIRLSLLEFNMASIWFRTIGAIIIYIICSLFVKLLQKIPKIGKIILP